MPTQQPANQSADSDSDHDQGRRVATIERAVDVLFLFADDDRQSLGVTDIANELGISKAVVHRVLTSLRSRRLISVHPTTRKYSLGPAVLELANRYRQNLDIQAVAAESLERLVARTNETATLSIRQGFMRVYVDQVNSPQEVRMTVQTGRHYPLHAGASSKAFLAFLGQDKIDKFFATQELQALTPETPVDEAALRKELETIRERGYARSKGERQDFAGSIAAPVMDSEGPLAVISVCGPLQRINENVDTIIEAVLTETRALSRLFGD